MHTLLTIIHLIVCVVLCLVVLLQSGKGGGMGATFGGATSQIFGGRGAGNFLTRVTSVAAVIFFITSLTLSMMSSRTESVVQGTKPADAPAAAAPSDAVEPTDAVPAASPEAPATPPEAIQPTETPEPKKP